MFRKIFYPLQTLICQRCMTAYHKMPHEKKVKNYVWTYIPTCKCLPCKNAGMCKHVLNEILPVSTYNTRICSFLQKFAAHLKPCGDTPLAEHCSINPLLLCSIEVLASIHHFYWLCLGFWSHSVLFFSLPANSKQFLSGLLHGLASSGVRYGTVASSFKRGNKL
jgi:hypothetical protein